MEKITRTAAYIRVSTLEQKLDGLSLMAQEMKLNEFAEANNLKIVEWYRDEGVSGRKRIKMRPELQRMLSDAQEGKFERIIFIKLDRYFRSVAEYHECQKQLNDCGVTWTATEEKYDLTTANGRAFVNMKLTIAELETDTTGERINIVNDYKLKKKEPLTGSMPQGYMIVTKEGRKQIAKDKEKESFVQDFFETLAQTHSIRKTGTTMNEKYGFSYSYNMYRNMAKNRLYTGIYRNITDYCPAYITTEEYNRFQSILSQNIKSTQKHRVYLFTGLLVCPNCNRILTSTYAKRPNGDHYLIYRCSRTNRSKLCDYRTTPSEIRIEKYLLEHVEQQLKDYIRNVEISEAEPKKTKHQADKSKIKEKIRRLNVIYLAGGKSDEEYQEELKALNEQLKVAEEEAADMQPKNIEPLKEFLSNGLNREIYDSLTRAERRLLWRSLIDRIHFDGGNVKRIDFKH